MSDTSNIEELVAVFDRFSESIDFTRPGDEGSVGDDLLRNQAVRILDRSAAEKGSEGEWEKNKGSYAERKAKRNLPVGVGLSKEGTDKMLTLQNLKGEVAVTSDEATMSFGVTDDAKHKGDWFTNGSEGPDGKRSGAKNQPPRPFYEITSEDEDAILDEAGNAVGKWLQSL